MARLKARDRRLLLDMDDRELADIGISRSDLPRICAEQGGLAAFQHQGWALFTACAGVCGWLVTWFFVDGLV
jgi:Domain of unknown function (DUF1127)